MRTSIAGAPSALELFAISTGSQVQGRCLLLWQQRSLLWRGRLLRCKSFLRRELPGHVPLYH